MTPEEKLSIRAAKLFTPKPWKHSASLQVVGDTVYDQCRKCQEKSEPTQYIQGSNDEAGEREYWERSQVLTKSPCTVPDPLPLTWDNAFKVFRSLDACQRTNALSELVQIFLSEVDDDTGIVNEAVHNNDARELIIQANVWLFSCGEPNHLIEAAVLAAEQEHK